jgi:DNA end-binding protein Ku
VRPEDDYFDDIPDVTVSPQMVEIAKQIISQAEGKFDPGEFRDRYQEAVRELVESKADGEDVVHRPMPGPKESNVIDLMDALRRSLKAPPTSREAQSEARREARSQQKLSKASGERGKVEQEPSHAAEPHARRSGGKHGQGRSGRRA